jgi:hypothetical protein
MRSVLIGLLLSGCYIVEPEHGSGGDDSPPPPGDGSGGGGSGPIGRTFNISRTPTSPSKCPQFAQENQGHTIMVTPTDVLLENQMFAFNVQVRSDAASEANFDSPNVVFTVFENWSSSEGPASPDVQYQLWVSGNQLTGDANASFAFIDTVCSYTWRIQ